MVAEFWLLDNMSAKFLKSLLAFGCFIAGFFMGCIAPRPQNFVDAEELPPNFVGREHRAFARGDHLIVEVSQVPGFNVVGFDTFEQDGAIYVSPRKMDATPAWFCPATAQARNPVGVEFACTFTQGSLASFVKSTSESRQPWALRRNPFGIEASKRRHRTYYQPPSRNCSP